MPCCGAGRGWRTERRTGRSTAAKDLRPPPLSERNAKVARLMARAPTGIVLNERTDKDGAIRVIARPHPAGGRHGSQPRSCQARDQRTGAEDG
jgi:hypothetical protein